MPILTVDGRSYTNARISSTSASRAIVIYDGGGTSLLIEKLPEDIQKKLKFDKSVAQKEESDRRQKALDEAKQQAEYKAALVAYDGQRGDPEQMQLLSVTGMIGSERCRVLTERGEKDIIVNPPQSAKKHLQDIQSLRTRIDQSRPQIEGELQRAQSDYASTPSSCQGSAAFVAQCQAEWKRAGQRVAEAKNKISELKRLEAQLEALEKVSPAKCVFYAAQTPRKYAGLEVWEFISTSKPLRINTKTAKDERSADN